MAQTNSSPGLLPSRRACRGYQPLVTESGYNSESARRPLLALRSESTWRAIGLSSSVRWPAQPFTAWLFTTIPMTPRRAGDGRDQTLCQDDDRAAGRSDHRRVGSTNVTKGSRAYYQTTTGGWVQAAIVGDTIDTSKAGDHRLGRQRWRDLRARRWTPQRSVIMTGPFCRGR